MRGNWLLEAAMAQRQSEQNDNPTEDGRDPWAMRGKNPRCAKCRIPMDEGCLDPLCSSCRPKPHRPKLCGIEGCDRKARANGRCRKHLHGDPDFDGGHLPRWDRGEF
jgi:hypothetical protein